MTVGEHWPSVQEFRKGMEMWDAGYHRGRRDALDLLRGIALASPKCPTREELGSMFDEVTADWPL